MRLQKHRRTYTLLICLLLLRLTQNSKKSTIADLTNIDSCICSESADHCLSSSSAPKDILFFINFNLNSSVDVYSKAWISEENIENAFGKKYTGKSISFGPNSSVKINSLEMFKGEGISVTVWLRMSTALPFQFSSILSVLINKSPFSEEDGKQY